ncbi:heme o synthase [Demequina capsici]|uniref:Protoheme IX farnesyltransferase n=1 Tax=Demequina capsici TaxID=3075620 RepID=A0AA96J865_9MICO|nr:MULTISPECIES: heme o synthase [unclassified Demequina]WNM25917.1 heme o synthase [Demequina sp. OYTSA14]WNM28818.1 heme o synthase [Demequina sp. PMTSA13]
MPQPATAVTDVPAPAVPRWLLATRVLKAYVALTKPRIIELLLVTTLPAMILAADGWPPMWLTLATLVGGYLSAGSANAFNSYIDRDIDAVMKRTRNRPLVTGAVAPRDALVFAWVLGAVSLAWFWFVVGSPLSAGLTLFAILGYVVGYTLLLKRRTAQNIVWGGIAGCMPALIGWAAVRESLSWTPFLLFLIVFFWTPPHYWPLSMKFRKDYAHAEVPMLPVVAPTRRVAIEMIAYAAAMILTSLVLVPVAGMTWVYLAVAAGAGAWFMKGCIELYVRSQRGDEKLREMRLFRESIVYLTLVFAAVLVDPFLPDLLTVWG